MTVESYTKTLVKKFAGSFPEPVTKSGTLLSGQNITTNLTFLESDATGKMKVHSGITAGVPNAKVAGLLEVATDATSGDTAINYYTSGCFFASELTFPAAVNSNLLKKKFLENTLFDVVFQDVGEV